MKTSAEIRTAFLNYFKEHGHEVVDSSSLVPGNDPTLLFTNAGMVQFKDVFLGQDKRPYKRATTAQRCVRAGGKHNDLENVGYTARHHTFFEMLGNFSFGDYFKHDAIRFAWEFLTVVLKLPAERLWVTVYADDTEAADIWLNEIGVDAKRFSRIGDKPGRKKFESDNFWSMGDTGPCGPCTEIFYDHGPEIAGGPPGTPEEDGDRYIEIWNLVFMQFNRDASGEMHPLPKPSVDTGMGLERLAAVLQDVHSNYEIDLFAHLIKAVSRETGCKDLANNSLKVIADHIRSCSFMIADGVVPSNEGRGYVLRRIIRRALRHGHKLGQTQPFFYKLVKTLVREMGEAYPELARQQGMVEKLLKQEEERFAETLDQGMSILEEAITALKGKEIPGETLFKLYDTYGFPVDLTADIARERGLSIDEKGFEKAMDEQRERARSTRSFAVDYNQNMQIEGQTTFTGYEHLIDPCKITGIYIGGEATDRIQAGQQGMIVLEQTPFYAESGGQVGDSGRLISGQAVFRVDDTRKQGGVFIHLGEVTEGSLKKGDTVEAQVDSNKRHATAFNHSATHLLHAALRKTLGEHVAQKGSLVDEEKLRFDFSHFEAVTPAQLKTIEDIVNEQIRLNNSVDTRLMNHKDAIASGAMALFGEKYGDEVRVLSMGDFSVELCGGTHVNRTGDIGLFKIVSESGIAAGVRRIEAVTARNALHWVEQNEQQLQMIAGLLKASRESAGERVQQMLERNRQLEKELEQLKSKLASNQGSDLIAQAQDIDGTRVLAARLDGVDAKSLRTTLDQLKDKLGSSAIVLGAVNDGKVNLIAGVSKDRTDRIKAGEMINAVALQVGGKGGGRPDMAQAGGTDPGALDKALASVHDWVRSQLNS